ncbi:hypothetical protein CERSUDRAFT_135729 [Gelatoporia subvermispora B]|uniref:Cytochrome P450 n=1 Tax=Ceriporiopsis subvermispora (strain B) TaxID=914234 RepID=M2PLM2_CERS8|nr:hypothetical protein CERSUDRAFT_135729 [Gelatoporia subvermispora B]
MPYGGRWREYKRAFNQLFNQTTVREYRPQLVKAARYLVKRLYNKPQDFAHHIRYSFGSSILSVVYGIQVAEEDDNYIATVEHALEGAEQGFRPGAFLVDFIPALKYVPEWVPGAEFQRKAAGWKKDAEAMKDVPWQNIVKDGDHTPVAMKLSELLSNVDASDFGEDGDEMSRNICAIAYAGGADTTVGAVHCFFLAMAIYPEVQRRAQQELTTVVGPNRMPEFSDWDSLPYISALCKESMRWQPTLPLSVAHRSLEDDEYRGYFIPAGSILIQNTWAILHDPEKYPDPERFNPERFLKDGRLDPGVKDVRAAFGAGRRICPGRYFSDMSLFITVASILHTFDISPPLDSESRPRKIEPAMGSGSMSHPLPFECSVKPRSKLAEAVALGDYSTEQR